MRTQALAGKKPDLLRHLTPLLIVCYLFLAGLLKVRGEPFGWEVRIVEILEPLRQGVGSGWLQLLAASGGLIFMAALTLAVATVFISRHQLKPALLAMAFPVSVYAAVTVTKVLVSYARPEITGLASAGFPSLHSALSLGPVLFLLLYTKPGQMFQPWQRIIWLVPLLVGFSRIAGGAHYPLDVVGGWLLGTAALAGLLSMRKN